MYDLSGPNSNFPLQTFQHWGLGYYVVYYMIRLRLIKNSVQLFQECRRCWLPFSFYLFSTSLLRMRRVSPTAGWCSYLISQLSSYYILPVPVWRPGTAWRSPWELWKTRALLSAARSAWTWVRAAASSTSTEPLRPAPQQRSGLDNKELYILKFVSASDWVSRWSWDPPQDLGWRIDCLSWRDRGLSLWSGYTLHQTR